MKVKIYYTELVEYFYLSVPEIMEVEFDRKDIGSVRIFFELSAIFNHFRCFFLPSNCGSNPEKFKSPHILTERVMYGL